MANVAIFHHPDAVESDDKPLAGRRTAGQSFLQGYVRHGRIGTLTCAGASQAHLDHFRELTAGYGWAGASAGVLLSRPAELARHGVLQLSGPNIATYAWVRRRHAQTGYSLAGITHTVSTRRIMEGLQALMSAPVEEWDAILCTSRAVQSVVAAQLEEHATFLQQRFAARRMPRPQLPIVPLGIDTAQFARDGFVRAEMRARFGLREGDIAVLSMGRLTVFEKMHPGPLFLALERAAETTGTRPVLLLCGWFHDERSEALHRDMAAAFAPSIRLEVINGRDPELRYQVWSAADLFCFPVDNVQETFGLAPVEAMAAGLPVICSDWDGFRDTVEHGVTGFRARTLLSRPGTGTNLAERFEDGTDSYHQYLAFVHQRTAVDIGELAGYLARLIDDADLRARMGAAGVERARRLYDWAAVIPQYEAVWAELGSRRGRAVSAQDRGRAPANPAAMDPFTLYAGYPTTAISGSAVLRTATAADEAEIDRLITLTGARQVRRLPARAEQIAAVAAAIATYGPLTLDDLGTRLDLAEGTRESAVLWLAKFGLVEIAT